MNNLYKAKFSTNKNRGAVAPQKQKIDLKQLKSNTIQSLNEVEYFLCNFSHFWRYIKLYKILK